MPSKDRGMIKWQPFDSLLSTKKVAKEITEKKNLQRMITLSEDQLKEIEENLKEAYYNGELVKITYYRLGKYYHKNALIKYIDKSKKQIILNDSSIIHFKQIVKITQI